MTDDNLIRLMLQPPKEGKADPLYQVCVALRKKSDATRNKCRGALAPLHYQTTRRAYDIHSRS